METINPKKWIQQLSDRLTKPLPGYDAQKLMEPPMRNIFSMDSSKAKKASTLLALYYNNAEWNFILIQRSFHPLDKHKGQISFPGGSIEKHEDSAAAAMREANEEIGIPYKNIRLIGQLSSLFIPISNFLVYPYIGLLDMKNVALQKEDAEVEQILHIPLKALLDGENTIYESLKMANGITLNDVPVFRLANQKIWGATAMILSEFKLILQEGIQQKKTQDQNPESFG